MNKYDLYLSKALIFSLYSTFHAFGWMFTLVILFISIYFPFEVFLRMSAPFLKNSWRIGFLFDVNVLSFLVTIRLYVNSYKGVYPRSFSVLINFSYLILSRYHSRSFLPFIAAIWRTLFPSFLYLNSESKSYYSCISYCYK